MAESDRNLNRIPGVEDRGIAVISGKEKKIVITGWVDDNEAYDFYGGALSEGITGGELDQIIKTAQAKGLNAVRYLEKLRPSQHTQTILSFGIEVPEDEFGRLVEFLQIYLREKK